MALWEENSIKVVVSDGIVEEITRVLQRPYFRRKRNITEDQIARLIELFRSLATWVPGTTKIDAVRDDPHDNKILACAVEGRADYLISGDDHLLSLQIYEGIPIISAAVFLTIYEQRSGGAGFGIT